MAFVNSYIDLENLAHEVHVLRCRLEQESLHNAATLLSIEQAFKLNTHSDRKARQASAGLLRTPRSGRGYTPHQPPLQVGQDFPLHGEACEASAGLLKTPRADCGYTPRQPPMQVGQDFPLDGIEERFMADALHEDIPKESLPVSQMDLMSEQSMTSQEMHTEITQRWTFRAHTGDSYRRSYPETACGRWRWLYDQVHLFFDSQATRLHPIWLQVKMNPEALTNSHAGPIKPCSTSHCTSEEHQHALNTGSKFEFPCCHLEPIGPFSAKRLIWDMMSVMICFYDMLTFPLILFDLSKGLPGHWSETMESLELLFACFWTLDILLSFVTAYMTKDGMVEKRWCKILEAYVKSWLTLDVTLVVVDWYLISHLSDDSAALASSLKGLRRILKMVRLMRLFRLAPKLMERMDDVKSEKFTTILHLLGSIVAILLLNHYVASSWCHYWGETHFEHVTTLSTKYLTGLHWSMAVSTLGSMDKFPLTNFQRLYTCFGLVASLVIFSSFISNITSATSQLGELRKQQALRVRAVRRYLIEHNIPHELSNQVWQVMRQNNLDRGDRIQESDVEVFRLLPLALQQELRYETVHKHLNPHPLFHWFESNYTFSFRKICINAAKAQSMMPYSTLFWSTLEGVNRMIFLDSGILEYHPAEERRYDIRSGKWACEEILWCRTALLSGPICAGSGGAVVILLEPGEFRDIVRADQDCCCFIREYAIRFVERFNTASRNPDYDDVLFNDHIVLQELLREAGSKVNNGLGIDPNSLKGLASTMQQTFRRHVMAARTKTGLRLSFQGDGHLQSNK